MQRFVRKAGATSQIIPISIYDSSSSTGAKLTGLVYNSGGLTAYYNRIGASGSATQITLATATKGTYTSGGFVAIDGTNMPGDYELHIPNAAIDTGAVGVMIQLKGATNMVPVNIYIDLVAFDLQVATQKVDVDTIKTQTVTCSGAVTVPAATLASTTNITAAAGCALTGDLTATMKASVNAEVVDALVTDTYAEPSSVPAATASLKDKIGWVTAVSRNKITQDSSNQKVRNDGDTADIGTAAESDNGTTFTRGKFA